MNREYDITLSFAGEDRDFALALANELLVRGLKVFYDNHEIATLWGKDLYLYLQEVYRDKAVYCIPIISEHYTKKNWTRH